MKITGAKVFFGSPGESDVGLKIMRSGRGPRSLRCTFLQSGDPPSHRSERLVHRIVDLPDLRHVRTGVTVPPDIRRLRWFPERIRMSRRHRLDTIELLIEERA